MKQKYYPTEAQKKEDKTIFHQSAYEVTMQNKPYIIGSSKSATYSKLDKAKKKEENKLKQELKDFTKYDL